MRAEDANLPLRRLLNRLWAGVWIAYGLWILRAGVRVAVDTEMYTLWADALIAHSFNISSFLNDWKFQTPAILYMAWIVLAAGLKSVFGASWMKAIVLLNWLAFGAGVYAVLDAIRRTTASAAGLLLAGLLFFAATDLLIFIPYVLSDLIFWGLSSVALGAGCWLAIAEPQRDRAVPVVVLGTLIVLFALVFRPAGLPLLPFWAAALASCFARGWFDRFATMIIIAAIGAAIVATAWHGSIMAHPESWPFGRIPGFFAVLSQEYHTGVLVYAPGTNLTVEPAFTTISAMRLTVEKLIYFMTPWVPSYSRAHTLMNLAFFLPAYGLTLAAIKNRDRLAGRQRRVVMILLLFLISVAVFHALVQIEYDHRYRLPMLPALIILAAIGLESVRRPQPVAHS